MAATPQKTAIEEANRQLNGMFQQMIEQEKRYKTELHEKEQEIVRLHQLHQQTEQRLKGALAAAEEEAERLRAVAMEKQKSAATLERSLAEIVGIAQRAMPSANGHPQPAATPLITPSKVVKLPSSENPTFSTGE
eukprot:m.35493 g.35493  ORF g.35493 m.35493 type:complete len:135 (-) comp7450_c0_seq1:4031-4435(-)